MTEKKGEDKLALVNLSGESYTKSGKLTRSRYFDFLKYDLDDYSNLTFTEEQAKQISCHIQKLQTGSVAMVPLFCGGSQCQPAGTLVRTKNRGNVPIEELSAETDLLWSWSKREASIRTIGYSFQKFQRDYDGYLFKIQSRFHYYECTSDHFVIAKWSERTKNESPFCVYLMQKGNKFRIGKTSLLRRYGGRFGCGPAFRARAEKADAFWILGVYSTNTEALLAEEYFSITWQIPKALFIVTDKDQIKWDGLYRWVTQQQLDEHHESLLKSESHYEKCLSSIGLDIRYPFWFAEHCRCVCNSEQQEQMGFRNVFKIRACNFISGYMSIPIVPEKLVKIGVRVPAIWEEAVCQRRLYKGIVYSLDVEQHHCYIANNIITHNCPFASRCPFVQMGKVPLAKQCLLEINMLKYWIMQYMEEYNVDPENFTEVGYCNELAEIEIYLWRLNVNLAKPENAELVTDQTIAISQDGTPVIQKQLSPFMQQKEQLFNRKSKIIKLMVGDRQERYKKEAALKQREEKDPSSQQAEMRRQIEKLHREMNSIEGRLSTDNPKSLSEHKDDVLTPDAILDAIDDEESQE